MKRILLGMLLCTSIISNAQDRPILAKEGGCAGITVPTTYKESNYLPLAKRWQHWAWPWPKIWTHETGPQLRKRLRLNWFIIKVNDSTIIRCPRKVNYFTSYSEVSKNKKLYL